MQAMACWAASEAWRQLLVRSVAPPCMRRWVPHAPPTVLRCRPTAWPPAEECGCGAGPSWGGAVGGSGCGAGQPRGACLPRHPAPAVQGAAAALPRRRRRRARWVSAAEGVRWSCRIWVLLLLLAQPIHVQPLNAPSEVAMRRCLEAAAWAAAWPHATLPSHPAAAVLTRSRCGARRQRHAPCAAVWRGDQCVVCR